MVNDGRRRVGRHRGRHRHLLLAVSRAHPLGGFGRRRREHLGVGGWIAGRRTARVCPCVYRCRARRMRAIPAVV
jgi:hypothetical protein